MSNTTTLKTFIRLPNDLIAMRGVDTEVFKFPISLDAGSRVVRLSVFGGVSTGVLGGIGDLKAFGIFRPAVGFNQASGFIGVSMTTSPIEFITMIEGGRHEVTVIFHSASANLTLYGADGQFSDYGWQAILEDLGPSTIVSPHSTKER